MGCGVWVFAGDIVAGLEGEGQGGVGPLDGLRVGGLFVVGDSGCEELDGGYDGGL